MLRILARPPREEETRHACQRRTHVVNMAPRPREQRRPPNTGFEPPVPDTQIRSHHVLLLEAAAPHTGWPRRLWPPRPALTGVAPRVRVAVDRPPGELRAGNHDDDDARGHLGLPPPRPMEKPRLPSRLTRMIKAAPCLSYAPPRSLCNRGQWEHESVKPFPPKARGGGGGDAD